MHELIYDTESCMHDHKLYKNFTIRTPVKDTVLDCVAFCLSWLLQCLDQWFLFQYAA